MDGIVLVVLVLVMLLILKVKKLMLKVFQNYQSMMVSFLLRVQLN